MHSHQISAPILEGLKNKWNEKEVSVIGTKPVRQIEEPAIKVRLPDSRTAESMTEISRTITITKNGELYFMDRRVDLKNLRAAIQNSLLERKKGFLRIKADKEVDVGLLVSVIDEVRLSDVKTFSIVTERR
jgi:biopolymer transport protein ExbD